MATYHPKEIIKCRKKNLSKYINVFLQNINHHINNNILPKGNISEKFLRQGRVTLKEEQQNLMKTKKNIVQRKRKKLQMLALKMNAQQDLEMKKG